MTGLLFNPDDYDPAHFDPETRRLLRATIDWFEARGKRTLVEKFHAKEFHADFLRFAAEEQLFATLLTPRAEAGRAADKRWDTARIAALSEVLGFYGLSYWYPWQVTILGLGPVWQSTNQAARTRAAALLDEGGVCAFGLSEKDHGADIYATDMVLTPDGAGGYRATGGKYYIGNGNVAGVVSVFGRIEGMEGPDGYVFFVADSAHPAYHLVKNVVPSQIYVSEFRLEDYPVRAEDVLHTGQAAFDAALNTVNIGKFNLCFGGIGIAEHAFHEAITHAHNRVLYGNRVTAFPHVRAQFVEAYARLVAAKLFCDRAIDYFRSANPDDRRYLLFNPVTKMKATTEAERIVGLLTEVVAAKSFEADTYLTVAATDIRGLPKLEGTVAVNLALILKFMPQYLFAPQPHPHIPTRHDPEDDEFLFRQGPARGLGTIRFHDWREAYRTFQHVPNVAVFSEQADGLAQMLSTAPPSAAQQKDLDFALALGELFTLVVYGQLILEQAELIGLETQVIDQVFDTLVRDFSGYAVALHGKPSSTSAQQRWALTAIRKPDVDQGRFDHVWDQVAALSGAYQMKP
ncbi:acyl-CoA dehydrogenase family protein [Actinokineospora spheciospongiae]|uniref:acyl-CoA dehydrogenase family protein n=1 Tax=Actinokineospora spheciospongiae TaxID=909613 RepID=UPI000D71B112|nr:acyl-CoA dehydrogenase family protein [Actinokineospora spheciospongiae]PWW64549.1 acyl-CoA dehydrogenase [Actinokineospora spheciospongiae]